MQKQFKKNYNKIGILGGTFDPPHIGHLYISKIALKKLKLNAVIWIITKHNPLKQKPYLSTKTRMRLSKSMTKSQKKFFVEYLDDKIKSRNTFDLLNFLKKKIKQIYNKVGILGGTFDPPHIGHLHISKIALKKLKLKKIIWIIAKQNPLKQKPYLNIKTRIRLSKDITKSQKKIFVKYLDDKVKSKNTFDLLNYFKKKNKKNKIIFFNWC